MITHQNGLIPIIIQELTERRVEYGVVVEAMLRKETNRVVIGKG
jgi:hypothetical protein